VAAVVVVLVLIAVVVMVVIILIVLVVAVVLTTCIELLKEITAVTQTGAISVNLCILKNCIFVFSPNGHQLQATSLYNYTNIHIML
jgi:hypothetical protein